jgi:hypothetical protein
MEMFEMESGLHYEAGKLPDYYTPVINKLNQMKNRNSAYDVDVIKRVANFIARIDANFDNEMHGISRAAGGKWQYRYMINEKSIKTIKSKDLKFVLEAKKKYLESLVS